MAIIHHNWLNSHASRKYPLDDAATGTDDTGRTLPDDVLLDLHISWPTTYGQYAFVGGVTITERLISIVIMAATAVDGTATFTPLGSVSIVKPAVGGSHHVIVPAVTGVGGFVMFGDVDEPISLRFSSAAQSLLLGRVARPYSPLPVRSLGIIGRATSLVDIVQLVTGAGMRATAQSVLVEGEETQAIVLELVEDAVSSTFQQYVGPCGARPESGTCKAPGIETIGGVSPDCDGNINIVFRQLVVGTMPECTSLAAGFVLDQGLGLADVCTVRNLIDPFGGEDLCNPSSASLVDSSSIAEPSSSESLSSESLASMSSELVLCPELPFVDCFSGVLHEDWVLKTGAWQLLSLYNPYAPEECCEGDDCDDGSLRLSKLTTRNNAVWDSCSYTNSLDHTITVDVLLQQAVLTTPANAGILLNCGGSSSSYWVAGLDAADNSVKLWRYNGTSLITESFVVISAGLLQYSTWYRITAVVTDLGVSVAIAVSVAAAANPETTLGAFTLSTTRYGTPDGKHGISTNRAVATFDYWRLAPNA